MERIVLVNEAIFITGVAGFIGSNLVKRLFKDVKGATIIGIDNLSDYYDVRLKEYRLDELNKSLPATAEQMVRLVLKGSNKTYNKKRKGQQV